jgi:hypothetical protein
MGWYSDKVEETGTLTLEQLTLGTHARRAEQNARKRRSEWRAGDDEARGVLAVGGP